MAPLVTTARRATTAAAMHILTVLVALVEVSISRSTRGRSRRRSHSETWQRGLIPSVRGRLTGRIHRHSHLLLLAHLGELESVDVRGDPCYRRSALHGGRVGRKLTQRLLGLQEAHVNILLMCSCNLLLLLLKQLNLLLYS